MSHTDRAAMFDDWAIDYNKAVGEASGFPFEGYADVLAMIVEKARSYRSTTILDVGTGTGNLAALFARRNCRVVGVDFSDKMLHIAQASVPNALFMKLDVLGSWSLLAGRRFDSIVSAYMFHEFDLATKMKVIERLFQHHLSDNGSLIIGDIAFATVDDRTQAHQHLKHQWDEDEHYWAADEALAACRQLGLYANYQQVSAFAGVFHMIQTPRS